jgi:hypothetical protein
VSSSTIRSLAALAILMTSTTGASAQATSQEPHQHAAAPQHDNMSDAAPAEREGSGTSWMPDDTPMYAIHGQAGDWMLMGHGNAFLQYFHDTGDRGRHQAGSINWAMGTATRSAAGGQVTLRGMFSLEPWTIRGCGYPDLLASGEVCRGEAIHDRQHPHDLFMELAASYDRPLARGLRLQIYGGPAGEPALGPAAFPHRVSALANPLAPITHHWLDATHISFGVLTAGVYGARWKAEGSVFNGREPDEHRKDFDFGALDSVSGRLTVLPSRQWAVQASAGKLTEAEAGHPGEPRIDVTRLTVSAIYHRRMTPGAVWASTLGWGRNHEPGAEATNAVLAETSVTLDDRDAWYGRFELAGKSAHDLDLAGHDVFTVAKLQAGYTRYLAAWNGLKPGFGAGLSAGMVGGSLAPVYGRRFNVGFAVYAVVRPGETGGH